jgi:hypothetical protein
MIQRNPNNGPPENEADRALATRRPDPAPLDPDRSRAIFEAALRTARRNEAGRPGQLWSNHLALIAPAVALTCTAVVFVANRQQAPRLEATRPFGVARYSAPIRVELLPPPPAPVMPAFRAATAEAPIPPRAALRRRRRPVRLLARAARPTFAIWRIASLPRPPAVLAWRAAAAAEETAFRAPLPVVAILPESDAPSLRVVAENVEPALRVTVHFTPAATEAGYARVAALRPAVPGSVVWYQSTMSGSDGIPDLVLIGQTRAAWRSDSAKPTAKEVKRHDRTL